MRLGGLHAEGYVHRDLKPGNVMWLPRENRWTVIDFGCAAKTSREAGLGFSIMYAAPEVIAAYRAGDRKMLVRRPRSLRNCAIWNPKIALTNIEFVYLVLYLIMPSGSAVPPSPSCSVVTDVPKNRDSFYLRVYSCGALCR